MYENEDNNEEGEDDIDLEAIRKRRLRYKKLKKLKRQKLTSHVDRDSKATPTSSGDTPVIVEAAIIFEDDAESTLTKTSTNAAAMSVESVSTAAIASSSSHNIESSEKADIKGMIF